jgi:hypothetical protein
MELIPAILFLTVILILAGMVWYASKKNAEAEHAKAIQAIVKRSEEIDLEISRTSHANLVKQLQRWNRVSVDETDTYKPGRSIH